MLLALATHLQAGEWAQADSLFATRGVHVLADTNAHHAWAAYRDTVQKADLVRFGNDAKVARTGVEATVRGAVAWVACKQVLNGGSASPAVGRGSAVLEKMNDRWTIVHYHISR